MSKPLDVQVLEDPVKAFVALDPVRSRLLHELAEPASAAAAAQRMGVARQKLNYHLKALEQHALVREVGRRKWGGLTERLLQASARAYVISPAALGRAAVDVTPSTDRLAASYLVALGARLVREVGALIERARSSDKKLVTLALDTEVQFSTPAARNAFARELTEAITTLVARHHDSSSPGRRYRLVCAAHPIADPAEPPLGDCKGDRTT